MTSRPSCVFVRNYFRRRAYLAEEQALPAATPSTPASFKEMVTQASHHIRGIGERESFGSNVINASITSRA
jgi:hypothetical protein